MIQSPELFFYKRMDAQKRIGKDLLILVAFKSGLIFGSKFNERQSKPGQWLMLIKPSLIIGGIGDLRDFKSVMLILSNFCQNMAGVLGGHYLTSAGIVNFATGLLRQTFEEKANALAINFIVADWQSANDIALWFVDFDGSIKQLKNFAVSGGSDYEKPLLLEELEKLPVEEKMFFEVQKEKLERAGLPMAGTLVPSKSYRPKKEAIAYLEKHWKPNLKKKDAIELVKKTFFECNPESHDKTIEITLLECGKKPEFIYFKKE